MTKIICLDETNSAIVAELKNVRKHPNADRMLLATVLGDTVIVGLDSKENDKIIYFDSNLCLSPEYLRNNNLYQKKELNKDPEKKGYFGNKGRVKAQNFRKEKSYGFVAKFDSLDFIADVNPDDFKVGQQFNEINGIKICEKYIVKQKSKGMSGSKKPKVTPKTNMFPTHWDTKHLKRNLGSILQGRTIYIEEKLHGTSGRIANVMYFRDLKWYEKILKWLGIRIDPYDYLVMNGSRRVNLTKKPGFNSFYDGKVRQVVFDKYRDMVQKGMQLYFEIVGFDTTGGCIQKHFPYGCGVGTHEVYLYRVTINTTEGKTFDMGREFVYALADAIGMKKPPLFTKFIRDDTDDNDFLDIVEKYTNGQSSVDNNTLREGVVVWYEDKDGHWKCLKNKSFAFLEFEGKQKDKEDYVDMEEQEEMEG